MTQVAYVIARFMMKFDAMEKPIGQDNLKKVRTFLRQLSMSESRC